MKYLHRSLLTSCPFCPLYPLLLRLTARLFLPAYTPLFLAVSSPALAAVILAAKLVHDLRQLDKRQDTP